MAKQNNFNLKLSPKLKRIAGAVKLPKRFNDKKELHSLFESKHLFKNRAPKK